MVIDTHLHLGKLTSDLDNPQQSLEKMKKAGIDGCAAFSTRPSEEINNTDRIKEVISFCKDIETFYPIYWIDPTADDAIAQVDYAVEAGIVGFKVICSDHYPGDPRAMKTYKKMAEVRKSLLFHTGILWDGKNSSKYNRPAEYEDLLDVSGLKFAMAHISWPWTDECIAVYGKFQNAYRIRGDETSELYIDTTPGTPGIYREDALKKLYTVGYDIKDNILFGTDRMANNFDTEDAKWMLEYDRGVHAQLLTPAEDQDKFFYKNFYKFWGIDK